MNKEVDFWHSLHEQLSKNGMLDSLKAELRSNLIKKLKADTRDPTIQAKMKTWIQDMEFKLAISMIIDFMTKNDLFYSMSVLAPESGVNGHHFSKKEIEEVLKISMPEDKQHVSLLTGIIQSIKMG